MRSQKPHAFENCADLRDLVVCVQMLVGRRETLVVCFAFLMLLSTGCAVQPEEPVAPTRSELCEALGIDPNKDPLCNPWTTSTITLLESKFPPGEATLTQVHDALKSYLISSTVSQNKNGTVQWYVVDGSFFARTEVVIYFDDNNVVQSITIVD